MSAGNYAIDQGVLNEQRGRASMTMAAANSPWAETVLPFTQSRNDLFARAKCDCPNPDFAGKPIADLMKSTIYLAGYDDNNFFDRVHAEPHEGSCRNCGRRYRFQWWRDGVAFTFLASAGEAGTAKTAQTVLFHEHATGEAGDAQEGAPK
jgi:hypothetical protein